MSYLYGCSLPLPLASTTGGAAKARGGSEAGRADPSTHGEEGGAGQVLWQPWGDRATGEMVQLTGCNDGDLQLTFGMMEFGQVVQLGGTCNPNEIILSIRRCLAGFAAGS